MVNLNPQPVNVTLPKTLDQPMTMIALSAQATAQPGWVPIDQVVTATMKVRIRSGFPLIQWFDW